MTINEFLEKQVLISTGTFLSVRKPLMCEDGFTMSVQASSHHYCSPRESNPSNGYQSVEIGFPSEKEDLLLPYAENEEDPTGTVYGYVPIQIVEEIVKKHGGIVINK